VGQQKASQKWGAFFVASTSSATGKDKISHLDKLSHRKIP
jgi:hypothetical protein